MEEKAKSIDQATLQLLDKAKKDGVRTALDRKADMKVQCGFGSAGVCCRNCSMGPCRVSPVPGKGVERGICGATADVIVSRNFARMVVGGAAAHSDHGRSIALSLYHSSKDGDIKVKDEKKLKEVAKIYDVETEGRDIYDIAHDVAKRGLDDYGRQMGEVKLPPSLPPKRKEIWDKLDIVPRAIDREIAAVMHSTHIGCNADAEAMIKMAMRCSLGDGWLGSYMATEFSDIMFGTPKSIETEANLGVLEKNSVNVVLHGHEPLLSDMIVEAASDPELVELAKSEGADGINLCGMCCTGNEVSMRHGIKIAGNFMQQELAVVTGAVDGLIVDVQCIMPALAKLSKSYHTKFITTSPKAHITDSTYIEFDEEHPLDSAKQILKEAILNFKNRDNSKVMIPELKSKGIVGYSVEEVINKLDKVVNTQIGPMQTVKPLADVLTSGVLRGAAGVVGCNNPKVTHNSAHIETIKGLIKNYVIVVATGCAAQAAAEYGLMQLEAAEKYAGPGLATVCKLVGIPPVLHMGSCVDISRILDLVGRVANFLGTDMSDLPVVGVAPEWMSEKAVSIGTYVVTSGIDTWLGVTPPVTGGPEVVDILTNKMEDWVGAKFFIETDPKKAVEQMVNRMNEKRKKLGI
ncbi:anaerobic carbon-monoxide dehydrogenase catalytic subunit [Clostridium sp. AWRP]|uniref:anaerobic carbon-monoxide dehydrogenase catalytic subunit n=1 Tax=Clostridium sp. AWRP TaxID=2212991 RepID=UPI000FDBFD66|nr:anaerobic carbon-monoxide dehydrogenase catalytic subunit [Clostridium sp. AWRP]AZV58459.1 anaerobic carbon-monoxide dehydrogenase catalytic subunit [Clostridium sp. AWRP]